ncbi:hypothetical protein E0K83_02750 [Gramella sp. BOM4]|nr:hypothetical protein [Christiangramia bathymodioli]
MKTKFQLSILLVVILIASTTLNAQQTHVITLNVDTSEINNDNVNQVSNFGQPADVSNKEYTINVSLGDTVVWRGNSTFSEDDLVLVEAINHEGGARVFRQNTLRDDPDNPGVVVGVVSEGREGDEEKYKISFRVMNNGERRGGTYHIDPKIRIR